MSVRIDRNSHPSVRDYIRIAWSWRLPLLVSSLGVAALAVGLSFVLPASYRAETTLMSIPSSDAAPILGRLGLNLGDLGLGSSGGTAAFASLPVIVRSRVIVQELLMSRFRGQASDSARLIDVIEPGAPGPKRMERATHRLRRMITTTLDHDTGILGIAVDAPEAALSAQIANRAADLLQNFLLKTAASIAAKKREFIQSRLGETRGALSAREGALRQFRQQNVRFTNSPGLQLEQERLERSLREQEELFYALQRQYESARIEEHSDLPVVSVLDPAVTPAFRAWPKRSVMAIAGAALGLGLCFMLAVMKSGHVGALAYEGPVTQETDLRVMKR